jgi:release factor glutamine methyltransferase
VRDIFRRAGFDTPELDARLLAEVAFGMGRLELVTREREESSKTALDKLQAMAARRLKGEPVVRILGEKEFYGLSFKLNAATLVPRPETEMLVNRALEFLEERPGKKTILDLGTGTGCIAVSILHERPAVTGIAIDINADAVAMAKQNAETHGVKKRLDIRQGSWFDPLEPGELFDVILSNPPYIRRAVIGTLAPEVKDHDPRAALDGGEDGLDAYRAIVAEAPHWLKPEGALIVEIGSDQLFPVKALFEEAGLADAFSEKDLADLDRMIVGHHV